MTTVSRSVGPLLEIQGLKTHFFTQDGTVRAWPDAPPDEPGALRAWIREGIAGRDRSVPGRAMKALPGSLSDPNGERFFGALPRVV